MKVFISWSGKTSKALAEILREWLPSVIQAVKPYFSPDDITKGSRWNTEVSKELEESGVGIICLTRDNLVEPWIMFEAGALSKNLDKSRVCPILFDVDPTDIKGPLVQFQASRFNKEDIKKVLKMINLQLGDTKLPSQVLDDVFHMWWPKLNEKVQQALSKSDTTDKHTMRSERDLLEEILTLTRSLRREPRDTGRALHPGPVGDLISSYRSIIRDTIDTGILSVFLDSLLQMRPALKFLIGHVRVGPSRDRLQSSFEIADNLLDEATPSSEKEIGADDEEPKGS